MYRWEIIETITRQRVIAIVRTDSAETATEIGRVLLDAGLVAVEVSLTTPGGLRAVELLASEAPRGAVIGAGTVRDGTTGVMAARAGARFLVSPITDHDVIAAGHRHGSAVLSGAATPTEVHRALELGADLVKLFPAAALGIDHLRAVRGPLPRAPLVPTGGIGPEDVPAWLDAGAVAVGIGGSLSRGSHGEVRDRVHALLTRLGVSDT